MNDWLFLSLLLAHVIADFYLQNDKCCAQKVQKKFKSWLLYVHSLLVGGVSWVLVPIADFGFYALIIAFSRLIIDFLKSYTPKDCLSCFIVDQVAHLAVIMVVASCYKIDTELPLQLVDYYETFSIPLFVLAVLLCVKPANIFIKLILKKYQIDQESTCESVKNAGALIGNLERLLTIVFVVIGQYEAIGFIIVAKSILRFKDSATAKTEYVLAGTLMSFGIALLCGLMVAK